MKILSQPPMLMVAASYPAGIANKIK